LPKINLKKKEALRNIKKVTKFKFSAYNMILYYIVMLYYNIILYFIFDFKKQFKVKFKGKISAKENFKKVGFGRYDENSQIQGTSL